MHPRDLYFERFEDVLTDVERLVQNGYERAGNWDLAQVLDHLTFFLKGAVDGYTFKVPWILKVLLGKVVLNRILKQKKMKRGVFTPQKPLPQSGGDQAAAVERFRDAVHRFVQYQDEYHESPFFGKVSRADVQQLNLIHCGHHLGYLIPKS